MEVAVRDSEERVEGSRQKVKGGLREFLSSHGFYLEPEIVSLLEAKLRDERRTFLFRGPAGSGKTTLASLIAEYLGAELVYFQATFGTSEDELLYKYVPSEETRSGIRIALGPLPLALKRSWERPVVLVLDEYDKTRSQADSLLLDVLQNYRLTLYIDEKEAIILGNPSNLVVIVISNDEREFSEPLMRRLTVIELKPLPVWVVYRLLLSEFDSETARRLAGIYRATLAAGLRKPATVQELRELGRLLHAVGESVSLETLLRATIAKYDEDWERLKGYLDGAHEEENESEDWEQKGERWISESALNRVKLPTVPLDEAEPELIPESEDAVLVYAIIPDINHKAYTNIAKLYISNNKSGPEALPDQPQKIGKFAYVVDADRAYMVATEPLTIRELLSLTVPGEYYYEAEGTIEFAALVDALREDASRIYKLTKTAIVFEAKGDTPCCSNKPETTAVVRIDIKKTFMLDTEVRIRARIRALIRGIPSDLPYYVKRVLGAYY